MNLKGDLLRPDVSNATTKVTITIVGHFFNDNCEDAYVTCNWLITGKKPNLGDVINVIESGKNQIINDSLKTDQN